MLRAHSTAASTTCSPRSFNSSCPFHHQQQRRQQPCPAAADNVTYTPVDNSTASATFTPPVLDISNLLAGQAATAAQIQQVQLECEATGFLAITGHGISTGQLQELFAAARQLFDLATEAKMQLVVSQMKVGRGYEISPEHVRYMQDFQQQQHHHLASTAGGQPSLEPSAVAGILSERFCCGPQLSAAQLQDPYYGSELGQVFFPPNAWPDVAVPQLQPQMLQCYSQCEVIAAALMRLFAAALGVEQGFFDKHLARHHSNMQVANYPSQLADPGSNNLRKKAHVDSGTLTLLASDNWLPGSSWQAGDGGLQLLNTQQEWLEVQVPPGALLVNLGSLMTRWTNTIWKSTLHRVTNPPPNKQHNSRRLSMAFFHKPAYDALVEVLPTCYSGSNSSSGSSSGGGRQSLPAVAKFKPAVVGDLTRQGILHKYQHLPAAEASRMYHNHLAELRNVDSSS